MRPEAYVAHHIPGRLRIRIPGAKYNSELLEEIKQTTRGLPNVLDVECNPLTGSLLIWYRPAAHRTFEKTLAQSLDSAVPFSLQTPATQNRARSRRRNEKYRPSHVATAVIDAANELDQEIRYATNDQLDLRVLLPFVAAGVGILALRTTRVTPLWLTLLIFAFSSFLGLHGAAEQDLALGGGMEILES
jgi:hypothetical protein